MNISAKPFDFLKTNESKIWWLLRLGVCLEYIGAGAFAPERRWTRLEPLALRAFGVITKEGWLPYFAVWGIPENWAWRIMPIVGTIDIVLGFLAFFTPRKVIWQLGD